MHCIVPSSSSRLLLSSFGGAGHSDVGMAFGADTVDWGHVVEAVVHEVFVGGDVSGAE